MFVLTRWITVGLLILGLGAPIQRAVAEADGDDEQQQQIGQPSEEVKRQATEKILEEADRIDKSKKGVEQLTKEMEAMMGPMMGQMMGGMVEGMAKSLAKPEVAEYYATFMRSYYLALINRGFTEEEAMKIVTSTSVPSIGGKQ